MKIKTLIGLVAIIALGLCLASCLKKDESSTYTVNLAIKEKTIVSDGVTYMQVTDSGMSFLLGLNEIKGFTYEAGYRWVIAAEKTEHSTRDTEYKYLYTVSKTKVQ